MMAGTRAWCALRAEERRGARRGGRCSSRCSNRAALGEKKQYDGWNDVVRGEIDDVWMFEDAVVEDANRRLEDAFAPASLV